MHIYTYTHISYQDHIKTTSFKNGNGYQEKGNKVFRKAFCKAFRKSLPQAFRNYASAYTRQSSCLPGGGLERLRASK